MGRFDDAAATLNERVNFADAHVDRQQRSVMVAHSVRLPRDLTERLFAEADRRGVTPSELIRDLISAGLIGAASQDDPVAELRHISEAATRALRALESERQRPAA